LATGFVARFTVVFFAVDLVGMNTFLFNQNWRD
jgi:hypothetical protein